jgi:small subunit ribosomal protein S20
MICVFRAAEASLRRSSLAHSLSAIKRVRQNEKRRLRNRSHRSELRTQIKKLRKALDTGKLEDANKLLPDTVSMVDVMVKKGIIHENAGNRYKSRLSKRLTAPAS